MNWTMFLLRHGAVKMDEAGAEGGGAPAETTAGGALTGTGGIGDAPTTDASSIDNSDVQSDSGYDWEHATIDDYFSKVSAPKIDGVEFDVKMAADHYGQFCIDNKISPEVLTKYLEMEGKFVAEQNKATEAEEARKNAEFRKGFEAQGAALKRDFSPQQIQSAVDVLGRDFAGDKDFMRYATREMSNNPSLVKLLVNWADTHQTDGGVGIGNGVTNGAGLGFAARWTGKNIA